MLLGSEFGSALAAEQLIGLFIIDKFFGLGVPLDGAAKAAGDQGKLRHLEEEVKDLEEYRAHHPEDKHDPTPLEVFCDLNPDAPECLVYDD